MTSHIADLFKRSPVKASNVRSGFVAAIVLGAVALPLLAFGGGYADADTPRSDTLQQVISRGMVIYVESLEIEVDYTPDGKFTAYGGAVTGGWRIDGDKLCSTANMQPKESCSVYPKGKKSGDTFEIATDQGPVQIRIR